MVARPVQQARRCRFDQEGQADRQADQRGDEQQRQPP
jgi:hypothetical protein